MESKTTIRQKNGVADDTKIMWQLIQNRVADDTKNGRQMIQNKVADVRMAAVTQMPLSTLAWILIT